MKRILLTNTEKKVNDENGKKLKQKQNLKEMKSSILK